MQKSVLWIFFIFIQIKNISFSQIIKVDSVITDNSLKGYSVTNLFDGNYQSSWRTETISQFTVYFKETKDIKKIIFYLGDSLKANEFTKPLQMYVHFYHLEKENDSSPYEYVDVTIPLRFRKNHGFVEFELKNSVLADEICFSFEKLYKGKSPILEIHEVILKGEEDLEEEF